MYLQLLLSNVLLHFPTLLTRKRRKMSYVAKKMTVLLEPLRKRKIKNFWNLVPSTMQATHKPCSTNVSIHWLL
jgi:hypothetical protein